MLLYITVAALVASAQAMLYTDCGTNLAEIELVKVNMCEETAKECVLKRNTNATIRIDFTPSTDVKSLQEDLNGVLLGVSLPFLLPQSDACKDNGLTCPLKAGQKVNYVTTLPILKAYPRLKIDLILELKNEDNMDLICIILPVRIS